MATPQYNGAEYNTPEYDSTLYSLSLTEAQGSADVRVFSDSQATHAETQASVDAIMKAFTQAARTESLSESDVRTMLDELAKSESMTITDSMVKNYNLSELEAEVIMAAIVNSVINGKFEMISSSDATVMVPSYNGVMYDTTMYNTPGISYGFFKTIKIPKSEAITLMQTFATLVNYLRTFSETITSTDSRALLFSHLVSEFAFLADSITVSITNKALNDIVVTGTWTSLELKPANIWTSQD